jgi:F-type H+-transporting ATPase subunit epsilon
MRSVNPNNPMRVEIYSLHKILFEGEAESVNCKTAKGEITVLDEHEPLISMLEEGPIKVMPAQKSDGGEEVFAVKGGFLEVNPNHVVRMLVEE